MTAAQGRGCRELPPAHPIRRQVEEGSAAANAAMPSVKLPLPQDESAAAKGWRNLTPCMCSCKANEKDGVVLDTSACSIHGKAAKRAT
jgi:hypothetical protein